MQNEATIRLAHLYSNLQQTSQLQNHPTLSKATRRSASPLRHHTCHHQRKPTSSKTTICHYNLLYRTLPHYHSAKPQFPLPLDHQYPPFQRRHQCNHLAPSNNKGVTIFWRKSNRRPVMHAPIASTPASNPSPENYLLTKQASSFAHHCPGINIYSFSTTTMPTTSMQWQSHQEQNIKFYLRTNRAPKCSENTALHQNSND